MSNNIQDFINQLKNIDVGNLLEKAKTVKVEDFRNIKFSDLLKIRENKYFYPISGILIASIFTIFSTIPSYKSMKSTIEKSKRYSYESNNLPKLNFNLDERNNIIKKFDEYFSKLTNLVISEDSLIYLARIIDESASRASIEIDQFRPINAQELEACSSITEEERAFNLESNFSNNNIPMPIDDQNFEDNFDDQDLDDFDINSSNQKTIEEIEQIINFNPLDNFSNIDNLLSTMTNNLSEIYTSNYYEILVEADYINIVNFLKSIQEYNLFIMPYCFSPIIATNQNNMDLERSFSSNGVVKAKIILNIPTN